MAGTGGGGETTDATDVKDIVKWSHDTDVRFIRLRAKYSHLFDGTGSSAEKGWRAVLHEMHIDCNIFPATEAERKWDSLLFQYKNIKEQISGEYFQAMDAVVGSVGGAMPAAEKTPDCSTQSTLKVINSGPKGPSNRLVYLTRIESFCASHRLDSKLLTPEANAATFGKCNNPNGHGHNYRVEVMVKGPVDPKTGMIMNVTELKEIINATVMNALDHKNIDLDVPYFRDLGVVSTAENITLFIWDAIASKLPFQATLHSVRLHETDKNICEYRGEFV